MIPLGLKKWLPAGELQYFNYRLKLSIFNFQISKLLIEKIYDQSGLLFQNHNISVLKHAAVLFGQNKLPQLSGLEPVNGAVVFNGDRFLTLKQIDTFHVGRYFFDVEGSADQVCAIQLLGPGCRWWDRRLHRISHSSVFRLGDKSDFLHTRLLRCGHGLHHALVTHLFVAPDVQIGLWIFGCLGLQQCR